MNTSNKSGAYLIKAETIKWIAEKLLCHDRALICLKSKASRAYVSKIFNSKHDLRPTDLALKVVNEGYKIAKKRDQLIGKLSTISKEVDKISTFN